MEIIAKVNQKYSYIKKWRLNFLYKKFTLLHRAFRVWTERSPGKQYSLPEKPGLPGEYRWQLTAAPHK
jgi:hypothetical protein